MSVLVATTFPTLSNLQTNLLKCILPAVPLYYWGTNASSSSQNWELISFLPCNTQTCQKSVFQKAYHCIHFTVPLFNTSTTLQLIQFDRVSWRTTPEMATRHQNSHSRTVHYQGGTCTCTHHTFPFEDTGYEQPGVFNYGSPHLRKTFNPGYHLLKPVGGFTILIEHSFETLCHNDLIQY